MSDQGSTRDKDDSKTDDTPKKPTLWRTVKSVAAAFLGVQSHKNWEEDMNSTASPLRFIFVGLLGGLVFFGVLFLITWVISSYIV